MSVVETDEYPGLVNHIKTRSKLDISEKRLPQGGRYEIEVVDKSYDLRVHVQPTMHGENVVIRILPQFMSLHNIDHLGFPPLVSKKYKRLIKCPAGMILIVGPTGAGKSTTLYSGLQTLAQDSMRKVITIEDPIEFTIDNIQQTQINPKIGFGFSDVMRSFVRQDPDVIMLGEIRDPDTALEAIRAAQTGHLVLSTMHCNDSIEAVQRLYDLGIHPNSISCELMAVLAQRLVKRICEFCREEVEIDDELAQEVFPAGIPEDFKGYKGKGCVHCEETGTRGRIAIIEFMEVTSGFRRAISQQLSVGDLRNMGLKHGLITMRDVALSKVQEGEIQFGDLVNILPHDRMASERADNPGFGTI